MRGSGLCSRDPDRLRPCVHHVCNRMPAAYAAACTLLKRYQFLIVSPSPRGYSVLRERERKREKPTSPATDPRSISFPLQDFGCHFSLTPSLLAEILVLWPMMPSLKTKCSCLKGTERLITPLRKGKKNYTYAQAGLSFKILREIQTQFVRSYYELNCNTTSAERHSTTEPDDPEPILLQRFAK